MMNFITGALGLIFLASSISAQEVGLGGRDLSQKNFGVHSDTYRIGSVWGKKEITSDDLKKIPSLLSAKARTGNLRGATAFVLGEFAGEIVIATNNHVCPNPQICSNIAFRLTETQEKYDTKRVLGSWPEIDLSLVTLQVPEEKRESLKNRGVNFSFENQLSLGQELMTLGYGIANNPQRRMVFNADDDCRIFSRKGESRLMIDPDELNPGLHKVWSFSLGCDISHGDSGSPLLDRKTGNVLGIVWTGRIPKSPVVQNSETLKDWLETSPEDVWKELSYGVPAFRIKEVLQAKLPLTTPETQKILKAILEN